MPTVTRIDPQKRKKDRFNIFLDDCFAFGLSSYALLESGLKVGMILSNEQIEKITKKEEFAKLLDLALNFLSFRPRSEKEIEDYLAKKIAARESIKFRDAKESPIIEKVVASLKKYKYADDEQFTKWYLESIKFRPKSLRLLKFELKSKGVKPEVLEQISPQDETKIAKIALVKKIGRWKNFSSIDRKKKAYQYLASRGFDFETIKEAFAFFEKKR